MANRGRGPVERADKPWTLSIDPEPDDTLIHCAYVVDTTQPPPHTLRLLCGAGVKEGVRVVTNVEDSNCLHCYEEARKRWHI